MAKEEEYNENLIKSDRIDDFSEGIVDSKQENIIESRWFTNSQRIGKSTLKKGQRNPPFKRLNLSLDRLKTTSKKNSNRRSLPPSEPVRIDCSYASLFIQKDNDSEPVQNKAVVSIDEEIKKTSTTIKRKDTLNKIQVSNISTLNKSVNDVYKMKNDLKILPIVKDDSEVEINFTSLTLKNYRGNQSPIKANKENSITTDNNIIEISNFETEMESSQADTLLSPYSSSSSSSSIASSEDALSDLSDMEEIKDILEDVMNSNVRDCELQSTIKNKCDLKNIKMKMIQYIERKFREGGMDEVMFACCKNRICISQPHK